jgi:hypothetical protein
VTRNRLEISSSQQVSPRDPEGEDLARHDSNPFPWCFLKQIENDHIRASRQGQLSACRSLEAAAHNLRQRACSFISALNLCDKLQNDADLEWPLQSDSRLVIAYREYTRERWDLIHALVDFELGSGMKRFLADWSAAELPLFEC